MAQLLTLDTSTTKARGLLNWQGFTLLEVLIAMAVLSISLTGVFRLQSHTMAMSGKARFYSVAPLLAQAKLSQIERDDIAAIDNGSGEFGSDYPGYSWNLSTTKVPTDLLENTPYNMLRIDLTIALNSEETYALRTYRFYKE